MQQRQMIAQQRQKHAQRQAMLAQRLFSAPTGLDRIMPIELKQIMPIGSDQITQAQLDATWDNPMARPVNLPQHLQAQQQQVAGISLLQQQQHQVRTFPTFYVLDQANMSSIKSNS